MRNTMTNLAPAPSGTSHNALKAARKSLFMIAAVNKPPVVHIPPISFGMPLNQVMPPVIVTR